MNFGVTRAYLLDANNQCLGTTIAAPNPVAYAMKIDERIVRATDYYGTDYSREQLQDRFWWVNEQQHGQYLQRIC